MNDFLGCAGLTKFATYEIREESSMATKTPFNIADTIGYDIYLVYRRMRKNFLQTAANKGFDITPEQWFTMNKLRNGEPMTQTDLLDDGFNDRPNITRILSQLEAKGWVQREDDPNDGRKHIVTLTKKGRKIHDQFDQAMTPVRDDLYKTIPDSELEACRNTIKKIDEQLREAQN